MLTPEEHLDNLVRHIDLVRQAGLLLGKRLMRRGEEELGRLLVARVFVHDATKFYGAEWMYLHAGKDVPPDKLELAVAQHRATNQHHPEYWGGLPHMPEVAVAEMVCDWYARAQEFGTGLRDWIGGPATERFRIDPDSPQARWIARFVDLLLEDPFGREESRPPTRR
jgi:hypothetical protein